MKIGDVVSLKPEDVVWNRFPGETFVVERIYIGETGKELATVRRKGSSIHTWFTSRLIVNRLVLKCVHKQYALIKYGDVIEDFVEKNNVYTIKGRNYLKASFVQQYIPVIKEEKKFDVQAEIDKWEEAFNEKLAGIDGLCAYSILYQDGEGVSTRNQIPDICHARIGFQEARYNKKALAVITDVSRKELNEDQFEYLDFILNRSHFSSIYIGNKDIHSFKKNVRGVRLDVNRGLNAVATAAILIRTIWEYPDNAKHWKGLVENDVNQHVAMLFAQAGLGFNNSGTHHIMHVKGNVSQYRTWVNKGIFIDEGMPYHSSKASYGVSRSWIGSAPDSYIDKGEKVVTGNSLQDWAFKQAEKLGIKIHEEWCQKYLKLNVEQLCTLAVEFEKEL